MSLASADGLTMVGVRANHGPHLASSNIEYIIHMRPHHGALEKSETSLLLMLPSLRERVAIIGPADDVLIQVEHCDDAHAHAKRRKDTHIEGNRLVPSLVCPSFMRPSVSRGFLPPCVRIEGRIDRWTSHSCQLFCRIMVEVVLCLENRHGSRHMMDKRLEGRSGQDSPIG